jgi:pyruvate/2-oxoglutarate dehydrogenase complex dihydrolipoamide dehydrogenase (E3) component
MVQFLKTDICVVGAGSGGLSVAAGAVQMGADVVLVEGGKMGGDCLNYGCVPSKALLAAAHAAQAHTHARGFGLSARAPQVNFAQVMDHVHDVISGIAPVDSVERFSKLGVKVVENYGRFISPKIMAAGKYHIAAKRFVVATGSRAHVPDIEGLADTPFLTNETIFDLRDAPEHLIIIGGGPIGMEMAQAHRRLGAAVTVIESARALGREDPEVAAFVLDSLRADGVTIMENVNIEKIAARKNTRSTKIDVHTTAGKISGTHLLVATGRTANIERLNLPAAGVDTSRTPTGQPCISIDRRLRTSNRKIFAIGDVTGGPQFTHSAGYQAGIVIRNVLFHLPARANFGAMPRVTYTAPELAHIGLSEAEARRRHKSVKILRWPFHENDRARAERETRGMIKAVVKGNGKILGVSIVGHQAGDLLAPWTLALTQGLGISALASVVAPYPTRGEVSKRAAGDYFSPTLFSARTRKIIRFLSWFRR